MWAEPILHVDMDSFFVEVERLTRPELKGRPVAVGGTGNRGVIASASYEARAFGVASAQPTSVALRKCPDLIVVSPAHGRYGEHSARVFAVFESFPPLVEGLSLDEAFLNVSGLRNHFPGPIQVAEAIRSTVRSETGLPSSVGIAATKFVAKLASKKAKPDGLFHVPREGQDAFLRPMGLSELWGVGPATLAGLQRLGITTVGELSDTPLAALSGAVGPSLAEHLVSLAKGIDDREVSPQSRAKQVSVEETYADDLRGRALVESAVMAHAQGLASRPRRSDLRPRTIGLKVRYADFTTVTRSRTRSIPYEGSREIYQVGRSLLDEVPSDRPIRLLGLAASSFEGAEDEQASLFDEGEQWRRIESALGDVEKRFGSGVVEPARLLSWQSRRDRTSDD